jgi:hypothetical protein
MHENIAVVFHGNKIYTKKQSLKEDNTNAIRRKSQTDN